MLEVIKVNKTTTFEFSPLIIRVWTILGYVSPINVHNSWGVLPLDVTFIFFLITILVITI
jgi:hypothetical protein